MIFYLLIIIIIILIIVPTKKKEKKETFKVFDIQRDVLSQTDELAKYLLLKN